MNRTRAGPWLFYVQVPHGVDRLSIPPPSQWLHRAPSYSLVRKLYHLFVLRSTCALGGYLLEEWSPAADTCDAGGRLVALAAAWCTVPYYADTESAACLTRRMVVYRAVARWPIVRCLRLMLAWCLLRITPLWGNCQGLDDGFFWSGMPTRRRQGFPNPEMGFGIPSQVFLGTRTFCRSAMAI